jgi:hypothetical protein
MRKARQAVVVVASIGMLLGLLGYGASVLSLRFGVSIIPGGLLSLVYVEWVTTGGGGARVAPESVLPTISIITWVVVVLAYRPKEMKRRPMLIGLGMLIAWYGLGVLALYVFVLGCFVT